MIFKEQLSLKIKKLKFNQKFKIKFQRLSRCQASVVPSKATETTIHDISISRNQELLNLRLKLAYITQLSHMGWQLVENTLSTSATSVTPKQHI
jgi:CRISPR/Cas system CMR-associated protein Cmr3 (group 5 of RAMP superfamily)